MSWKRFMAPAIVVVAVAAVIFLLSAQPHSAEFTAHIFGSYNHLARKTAHMTEYAVFAATLLFAGRRIFAKVSPLRLAAAVLVLCALFAATDEFHQIFVPGRTPLFSDVLIDSFGAALSCTVFLLFRKVRR